MSKPRSDIAFSPTVKKIQERLGSRKNYEETEQDDDWWLDTVTPELAEFIAERDSIYLGTVSADGQPYIQHRGGPKGFLKILDEHTLGFADFFGNRQYISFGNLEDNEKAFIFLMDYTNRRRIKVWGAAKVVENDPGLMEKLVDPDYRAKPERAFVFRITCWDGNCPQHINPRYTEEQIQELDECPCCDANPGRYSGTLEVSEVVDETPNVKTFRLVQPGGGDIPFTYLPGQFLTLDVSPGGKRIRRSYTIASTPTRPNCIEITVKREEKGVVSNYLHEEIKPGASLKLSAPSGTFTFTGEDQKSVALIAAGVGVTPIMSVVRYLTDQKWEGAIFMLLSFRNREDFIFYNEIENLKSLHPNLHVEVTMSRPSEDWIGPRGRLSKELIADFVPAIRTCAVHICGPEPMMDDVGKMLVELDIPKEQIKKEAFGTVKRKPKTGAGATASAETAATITFASEGKSAPLPPGEAILEVADAIGVDIDNACRSGTCGSCKVKLVSGNVTMDCEDALTSEEKAEGVILACQAKSTGDVEVDVY